VHSATGGQPVGDEARRRQDVAQIVVDLGHRSAERRQPRTLPERLAHRFLKHSQFALGDTDLVLSSARRDHPRGILRISAKIHHAGGDPPHRPHQ